MWRIEVYFYIWSDCWNWKLIMQIFLFIGILIISQCAAYHSGTEFYLLNRDLQNSRIRQFWHGQENLSKGKLRSALQIKQKEIQRLLPLFQRQHFWAALHLKSFKIPQKPNRLIQEKIPENVNSEGPKSTYGYAYVLDLTNRKLNWA